MSPKRERLLKCLVAAPLGAAFVAIGVRHFTEPSSFDDIVPAYLGWPRFWTYASGVFEVTLGAGLCAPAARAISAKMLMYLVLLMSLANFNMWWKDLEFNGTRLSSTGHLIRLAIQITLLATLLWLSKRCKNKDAARAADDTT